MKKLRMIMTSVIVLAIVSSAFAFKTKVGSFCILSGITSGSCTTFKEGFKLATLGGSTADYRYYPTWDGDRTTCTLPGNNKCTAQIKLVID